MGSIGTEFRTASEAQLDCVAALGIPYAVASGGLTSWDYDVQDITRFGYRPDIQSGGVGNQGVMRLIATGRPKARVVATGRMWRPSKPIPAKAKRAISPDVLRWYFDLNDDQSARVERFHVALLGARPAYGTYAGQEDYERQCVALEAAARAAFVDEWNAAVV